VDELVPLSEVARALGRFQMLVNPRRPNVSHRKSEMSLAKFRELGFDRAAALFVTRGDYMPGLRDGTLGQFARAVAHGWALDPPAKGNLAEWRRLLSSDMPIIVEAPADAAWITQAIRGLHAPTIFEDENYGLNDDAFAICRQRVLGGADRVVFAFGLYRQAVNVFGQGAAFETALAALQYVPCEWLHAKYARRVVSHGYRLVQTPRPLPA
jgi:hypothetical protein